ncbi:MAG: carbohydrate ABC transporter permease [Lachnospiraceae bacterium]|nr:carbohydrate ABC transporter permease [Lachnospiraceae bacterium]
MRTKKRRIKKTLGEHIFITVNGIFLSLFFVIALYPIIYVLSASVSDPVAVSSGKMFLWPVGFNVDGYEQVLRYKDIWSGYANTIFYTVVGTILNLVATIPAAYALSRKDLEGRNFIMTLFIITMYFSGGLIPTYLNMSGFGLVNTRWSLLLSGLVGTYNLIVARTFFANNIPMELQEAAYLDGATTFQLLLKVVLPLSAPIIVVMALYYGVGHWNQYFQAMIYLRDRELYPLQVILKEILTQSQLSATGLEGFTAAEIEEMLRMSETADRMKYCIIVVSMAPMLAIYPWLQKYFAKGVMVGSVKG